jgi:hypothetical protein
MWVIKETRDALGSGGGIYHFQIVFGSYYTYTSSNFCTIVPCRHFFNTHFHVLSVAKTC